MNAQELDRLLCERLGIKAISFGWHVGCSAEAPGPLGLLGQCKRCGAANTEQRQSWGECPAKPKYPALSTTGDGMLKLMETLRYMNHEVMIEHLLEGLCYVRVGPAKWEGCLPAPLSLALAAAAALGIEVPE